MKHVRVQLFNQSQFPKPVTGVINRYACLVAEPKTDTFDTTREVVGVVDVTVLREDSVLQHLPGAEEYLYVSGIAVLNKFRFKSIRIFRHCLR